MKRKFVIKKQLNYSIFKRLNKIIPQNSIKKAVDILINCLVQEFIKNNSVSVKNFGTFSPYLFKGHKGYNVNNGKFIYVKSFISIKFRTHNSFKKIVLSKRKFLK